VGVGRLGLPDQDYYSSQEKDTKEKEISTSNIARMLQFIGETPVQAKASAAKILALEIKMSNPRLDRRAQRW
jgi:endothelin-converting enzyme/putative endopeptidase